MNGKARWIASASVMLLLAAAAAFAKDDVGHHRKCTHCGMDRKAYGYSRMLVRYGDSTEIGVCSLRCAVVETSGNPGKKVTELLVADRDSRKLIVAETAIWAMGGKNPA